MKINIITLVYLLALLIASFTVQAQAPVRGSSADVTERLERLEQLLQSRGLLDMMQQLQGIQRELNQLRGEIEIQGRNIEELRRRQRALYTDIDQRLQGAGGSSIGSLTPGANPTNGPPLQTLNPVYEDPQATVVQAGPEIPGNELPATGNLDASAGMAPAAQDQQVMQLPASAPATQDPMLNLDPVQVQSDYQQAFDLLKQSRYEDAIKSFQSFLEKYPVSDYSDNAQYWLGEAYYVMRQFEQALQEYNTLVESYPQSQKFTHALLKIGYSYHELGLIDDAKKYLQSLIRDYPGTTASRLAEERLKAIALSEQQSPAITN